MTIRTLFTTTALTLLTGTAAIAQESVTVNIGSSHPEANIWVYAMKNAFQPEVDRILAEKGEYKVDWNEAYGGTLYKLPTHAPLSATASSTSVWSARSGKGQRCRCRT